MSVITKQLYFLFMVFIQNPGMKCENVLCGQPGQPAFGFYSPIKSHYIVNETVQFTCIKNYHVAGYPVRTCTPSGEWDGNIPLCLKPEKIFHYVTKSSTWNEIVHRLSDDDKETCVHMEQINNGSLLQISLNQTLNVKMISFHYEDSYTSTFEPEVIDVCLSDEDFIYLYNFNQPFPKKEACNNDNKTTGFFFVPYDPYRTGKNLAFNSSKDSSNCFGICEIELYRVDRIPCGVPEVPLHGIIYKKSDTDSIAEYSCDEGYSIEGNAVRRCSNGEWLEKPPQCLPNNVKISPNESNMNVSILCVIILIALCLFLIVIIIIIAVYNWTDIEWNEIYVNLSKLKLSIKKRNDSMKRGTSSQVEYNSKVSCQNNCVNIQNEYDDINSVAKNDEDGYLVPIKTSSQIYEVLT